MTPITTVTWKRDRAGRYVSVCPLCPLTTRIISFTRTGHPLAVLDHMNIMHPPSEQGGH